jgi:hypothetical protein
VEVDFLIHEGGRFRLFEAKSAVAPSQRDADGLKKFISEVSKEKIRQAAIISRASVPFPLDDQIKVLGCKDLCIESDV